MEMEVVSVRVDSKMRKKMRSLSHVNWSEVIRRAIGQKIREEELERRNLSFESLRLAAKLTDELRRPSPGWRSEEEIRKWRDQGK